MPPTVATIDTGTRLAVDRTWLAHERTMLAWVRTAASLISFGFTIFQVFQKLRDQDVLTHVAPARNFGITLVALGIGMLVLGIVYHIQFMIGLRHEREAMRVAGLIHGESRFPASMTLIIALLLLLIGIFAIISMTFQIGPFG